MLRAVGGERRVAVFLLHDDPEAQDGASGGRGVRVSLREAALQVLPELAAGELMRLDGLLVLRAHVGEMHVLSASFRGKSHQSFHCDSRRSHSWRRRGGERMNADALKPGGTPASRRGVASCPGAAASRSGGAAEALRAPVG